MDRGIYEFHKGNWSFTKSSYKSHSIFVMEGRGTIGVVGAPMQAKTTIRWWHVGTTVIAEY